MGTVTAQFLKENFIDKGRDVTDFGRFLQDRAMHFTGDALMLMMNARDLNTGAAAWNLAHYHLHPEEDKQAHLYSKATTDITQEQFDQALKQAENLGLPGQPRNSPDDMVNAETGYHEMSNIAGGLLQSNVALPDAVRRNAAQRAAGMGSSTSTWGLARRIANGQFSPSERHEVTKTVGWPQLLGQRGAWPEMTYHNRPDDLAGLQSITPDEAEEAWNQLQEVAKREPTGDSLTDSEPRAGIEHLIDSFRDKLPKRTYDFLVSDGFNSPEYKALVGTSSPDALKTVAIRNTPYPEHHQQILKAERRYQKQYEQRNGHRAGWHGRRELEQLLMHNKHLTPEYISELADVVPEIIPNRAAGWVDRVPGLREKLHDFAVNRGDENMAHDLIRNEVSTATQMEQLVTRFPRLRSKLSETGMEWSNPDLFAEHKVAVAFDTNKLRQARDHILRQGKTELSPKQMPPGNWSAGRLPNGNISAALLQQAIDTAPRMAYNVTHGRWDGGQRHSEDESNVFQLNITHDQVQKLKDAGVYDRFRKMHQASRYSGHPLGPTGIGWVRWTGGKKTGGIFIDEVQSDFGQSFVKQAAKQAREQGYDEDEAAAAAAEKYGSENEFDTIKNIVFGGKHPSEVLQEAFHEWLRTPHVETQDEIFANGRECKKCGAKNGKWGSSGKGAVCKEDVPSTESDGGKTTCRTPFEPRVVDYVGLPIHIWQPESKATISLGRAEDKLPGHFYVGYRDVPSKKMGFKPGEYGELETQSGSRHKAKVNHGPVRYERECDSCGHQLHLDQDAINDGYRRSVTCPSCGIKQASLEGFTRVDEGEKVPGKATWKEEVRKSEVDLFKAEDQREHRPIKSWSEHSLPVHLMAEGYRMNVAHMPGFAIAAVTRHGKHIGAVEMSDFEPREEWTPGEPSRTGLRESVLRVLEGHVKGSQEPDGWNHVVAREQLLSKAEEPQGLRTQQPAGFHAQPEGHQVTSPHPTYAHAAQAKPKGVQGPGGQNVWVRPHHEPSNAGRTLMVQFTSDLLQGNRQRDASDDYYDNLYSKREGYHRPDDWWEVPQWQAHIAHSLPHTDHYTVRSPEEAVAFMKQAGYKNVAFSSLDVTAPFIKKLAQELPNQHFVVGGYTDMNQYAEHPNVTVHPTVESFVQSEGHEYKPGYDYRHFNGAQVIPRLTLSDGCRHNCTFCCVPKQVTEVPMSVVEQQADAFAKDLKADLVYLNDKTFGQAANHAHLPALFQRIRAKNPGFKGFVIQTTAAQMKRFTPEFIRDAGIRHIELGIESVNDPILRAHKKPANEALIEEAAQKVRAAGSSLIPNIMVGLPGEDKDTYGRTMDWLKKNRDIISHVNTYNLALYEESELGKKLQAVNAADRDENQQVKSWMTDPAVHKQFAEKLFQFANEQLDQPIGHGPMVAPGQTVGDQRRLALPLAKSELPSKKELGRFAADRECYEVAAAVAKKYKDLKFTGGFFVKPDGEPADHAWNETPDGTIIDAAYSQFDPEVRIGVHRPGSLEHKRYRSYDEHHPEHAPDHCLLRELGRDEPCQVPGCTWKGGDLKKSEDPHPPAAASILVHNEHGQVLWGMRRKDGKWTLPGGHLEPGEDPATGAVRELLEESGLTPESIHHFGTANTPDGIPVFMFHATVDDQQPHGGFDPDHEVAEWRWVDCLMGVPPAIRNNLAHPKNVIVEHLGW